MTAYPSEATVLVNKFQQITSVDLTDSSTIGQATTDNVVASFLAAGQTYTGLGVTIDADATGVTVGSTNSKDMLFNAGGGFPLRSPFEIDLASEINAIPDTVSSQIILIVANGGVSSVTESRTLEDASLKPNNPADLWPTVQQVVTTRVVRACTPSIVLGTIAASNPQPPAYNPLLCLLATVTINKTGVASVTQNTAAQITPLDKLAPLVLALSSRVANDENTLAGLTSTVSGLALTLGARLANDEAALTALAQKLAALESRQVTTNTGSILTVTDYYTDTSGLTPGDGTGYGVGTGLTFPQSTRNPTTYFPLNAYGSNLKLIGGRYLTAPYTEQLVQTQNNAALYRGFLPMGQQGTWNPTLKTEGFGVARTRYGASYPAQATTQLQASGDPTRLFALNPTDLVYDASWADWRIRNPELNHSAGYWHDLTSRDYWTPRTTEGAALGNLFVVSQVMRGAYPEMMTSYTVVAPGPTPQGVGRLIVCEDLNGAPDPSAVMLDLTVSPALGRYAEGWTFVLPYPFLRRPSKTYHFVFATAYPETLEITKGVAANPTYGPLLYLSPNGSWSQDPSGCVLSTLYTSATFSAPSPIELNLLYLGGGIDNIDLLTPAIVPDGCDTLYGTIPQGSASYARFGAIDPNNAATNLLAGRPSQLRLFLELLVTPSTAPVIDLQASASGNVGAVSARRSNTLSAESPIRTPSASVTKITRQVTLVGFNPAFHTYTEQLETGTGYATLTSPTVTGTPVPQADGTTLLTFSWTLGSAVPSFKLKYSGTTSDTTQQFRMSQSITTAAP